MAKDADSEERSEPKEQANEEEEPKDEADEDEPPKKGRQKVPLNEETLGRIKAYLQSDKMHECLDEDAIAVRILRTDRVASDQARFHHDPYQDEDEQDIANRKAYIAAQEYALALEFYKHTVSETQAEDAEKALDKRTLHWLRKAMGLPHRNDFSATIRQHHLDSEPSEESEQEEGTPKKKGRRLTRGMVRSTRIKRRKQRVTKETEDLDALLSAVTDIEKEFGPLDGSKDRKKQSGRRNRATEESSNDETGSQESKRGTKRKQEARDLVAVVPVSEQQVSKSGRPLRRVNVSEKLVKITRLIVGGNNIVEPRTGGISSRKKTSPVNDSLPLHNLMQSSTKPGKKRKTIDSMEDMERKRRRLEKSALTKERRAILAEAEREQQLPGKLLGPMDPLGVLDMECNDYVAQSSGRPPISLPLLEWKRREQWDPSEGSDASLYVSQGGTRILPPKLRANGISASIPTWDYVNPIPDVQRQPMTTEPLRRRHSDAKYAEWTTNLINCLKGSGRTFAYHEFFYSDIDRPWFNVNEFQIEAAKLGVPLNAKLTRKEWSLVRRSIPNRPRRFSQRFIRAELDKLYSYREYVRKIQRSKNSPTEHAGYDIPARIKVGSTVTAFHALFRIVHRGVVIACDAGRNRYLVQFERQELGFQFCMDTQIASHGVPEMLVRASHTALDGSKLGTFANRHSEVGALPLGTSYGPVYVDQLNPVAKDKMKKTSMLKKVVSRCTLDAGQGDDDEEEEEPETGLVLDVTPEIIEKVAERESLVQLVGTIEAGLKRKKWLLDEINACNQQASSQLQQDKGNCIQSNKTYSEHYTWLLANLQMTNKTLESSLVYLKVMYSEAYTGMRTAERAKEEEHVLEKELGELCSEDDVPIEIARPCLGELSTMSRIFGSHVASHMNADEPEAASAADQLRAQCVKARLSAASRILLNANYCASVVLCGGEDEVEAPTPSVTPFVTSLEASLADLMPSLPEGATQSGGSLDSVDNTRISAMRELKQAVKDYGAELAAFNATQKILRS